MVSSFVGRYNKFSRVLSQTPWIIDNVRLCESSVEVILLPVPGPPSQSPPSGLTSRKTRKLKGEVSREVDVISKPNEKFVCRQKPKK